MMFSRMLPAIAGSFLLNSPILLAQTSQSPTAPTPSSGASAKPLAFDVATIKPTNPNAGGMIGFLSYPGGRIILGHSTVEMMMSIAYHLPESGITGGPDWVGKDLYEVTALPPNSSESRTAKQPPFEATPSAEQRQMLQSLLADRFALKVRREMKQGPVYLLTLGSGRLQLQDPKHNDADSRAAVIRKSGGIADGEAFGTNVSMAFLAEQLRLDLPVVDQTGLKGFYDFHLDADEPENKDYSAAVFDAMNRLGLKLKRGNGPVETVIIDHIEKPSEN